MRWYNRRAMPTYEYRCQDCGSTVEVVQSFKDEPLTVCGVCGGRLRRVFHPVGIVLKGSGFYSTDNRSGKKPATAASSSGSKSKDDKPAETTSETKPDSAAGKKSEPTTGKTSSGGSSGSSAQAS